MKKTNDDAMIGDFILTNELFSVMSDKVRQTKSDIPGIIVSKTGALYGVRFGAGHSWTLNIGGILSGEYGYMLDRSQFIIDNE